jgi:hypothetical protein
VIRMDMTSIFRVGGHIWVWSLFRIILYSESGECGPLAQGGYSAGSHLLFNRLPFQDAALWPRVGSVGSHLLLCSVLWSTDSQLLSAIWQLKSYYIPLLLSLRGELPYLADQSTCLCTLTLLGCYRIGAA